LAVTVTVKTPLAVALHESVELPLPPATDVGVMLQVNPVLGDTDSLRLTGAAKPLRGFISMVELSVTPMIPLRLAGMALSVKSSIVKVAVTE
jgi:hypothetical protein